MVITMYATEAEVLAAVRARTGVAFPNFTFVWRLHKVEYLAVLAALFEILQSGVAGDLVFGLRNCFNSKLAAVYYRDIFFWWLPSVDETERLNHERALEQTYRKTQASWTWRRMAEMAAVDWPSSLIPLLWRHLSGDDRDALLAGAHRILDTGGVSVFVLVNLVKADNAALLRRIDGIPELPRLVRKKVDARLGRRNVGRPPGVQEAEIAKFVSCWSIEVDEERMGAALAAGRARLGWGPAAVEAVERLEVPEKGWVRLWSEVCEGELHWVAALREDDSVVILHWLRR